MRCRQILFSVRNCRKIADTTCAVFKMCQLFFYSSLYDIRAVPCKKKSSAEKRLLHMKDKTVEIFEDAPVPKAVFVNIIPSVISMLMVLIYNLADTFFIGQTHGCRCIARHPCIFILYGSRDAFRHWRNIPDFKNAGGRQAARCKTCLFLLFLDRDSSGHCRHGGYPSGN